MNWYRLSKLGLVLLFIILWFQAPAESTTRIVAFGDSNTAGFGVAGPNKYPSQLERNLRARGFDATVRNSGVNGDTTGGGLRRLDFAVPDGTDIAIVFFGRNDVRFGVPEARMRRNLDAIVNRLRARGVYVILYAFHPFSFAEIARRHGAAYGGDFFAGVANRGVKQPQYSLRDFVPHLNAAGYTVVARRIEPLVVRAIQRVSR